MSQHPTIEEAQTVDEVRDAGVRSVLAQANLLFRGKNRIESTAMNPFNDFKNSVRRVVRTEINTIVELGQFCTILYRVVDTERPGNDNFNAKVKEIIDDVWKKVEVALKRLETDEKDKITADNQFSALPIEQKILLLPETVSGILIDYLAALQLEDYETAQELLAQAVEELIKENEANIQKLLEEKGAADQLLEEAEGATLQIKDELQTAQANLDIAKAELQDLEATKKRLDAATEALRELETIKENLRVTTEYSSEVEGRMRTLESRICVTEKLQIETQSRFEVSERKRKKLDEELDRVKADLTRSDETVRRLRHEKDEIVSASEKFEKLLAEVRIRLTSISTENDQLKQRNVQLEKEIVRLKTQAPQPAHEVPDIGKDLEALADVGMHIAAAREKLEGMKDFSRRLEQVGEIRKMVQVEIGEANRTIEDLKQQVAQLQASNKTLEEALRRKDAEILGLQKKLRTEPTLIPTTGPLEGTQSTVTPVVISETDYARKNQLVKKQLKTRLARLEEEIRNVDAQAMEILAWLQEVKEKKEREFIKLKLVLEGQDISDLKERERQVDMKIAAIEEKHTGLQVILTQLEGVQRGIVEYLRALEQVEKGPPPVNIPVQVAVRGEFHMPPFEELMGDLSDFLPKDSPEEHENPADVDRTEKFVIEGLPFTVEFTTPQLQQIRQCEALLESLKTMAIREVRGLFPYDSPDKKKYYDALLESLHHGTFLPNLKKAVVILGALRSDNEFKGRISRTVMIGMKINTVKIVTALGPETEAVTWALIQADILGGINPVLCFIQRTNIGGQFGPLNELTPLGQIASQVWTKDLLEAKIITVEQLVGLHTYAQDKDG